MPAEPVQGRISESAVKAAELTDFAGACRRGAPARTRREVSLREKADGRYAAGFSLQLPARHRFRRIP
jgi:hypothetical protein